MIPKLTVAITILLFKFRSNVHVFVSIVTWTKTARHLKHVHKIVTCYHGDIVILLPGFSLVAKLYLYNHNE